MYIKYHAKITHTYVRLHSCVALHLELSMNAAANLGIIISKISHNFHLSFQGGRHSFTLPEREGEGERERERWRVNGRKREREGEGGRE